MVVITFQNLNVSEPVHLLTSLNNWEPVPMTQQEDGSEDQNGVFTHSLSVPDKVSKILYKFRIGEDHYLHDESAPAGKTRVAALVEMRADDRQNPMASAVSIIL
jgi:hypothetical protein